MQDETSFRESLGNLLDTQNLAVLSTCRQDRPYSSIIGFVATEDFRRIIFATLRDTRKYANIQGNEHVSILIDSRTNRINDFRDAIAVRYRHGTRGNRTGTFCPGRALPEAAFLSRGIHQRSQLRSYGRSSTPLHSRLTISTGL